MATYYKYAERDKDAYVDWSVIGKDISDKLDAENKFREDKKAEIDKNTREYSNYLNNPIQGEYTPANEFILDFANTAQQSRLLQDKLLKSGQWTLKQYTIARQNTKDGTDNLFNMAKYYQDNFKTIMTKWNNKEIQAMNITNLASMEGFANFSNSKGVINDVDGTVSMAGVYVDPKTGLKKIDKNIVPTEVMLKSLTSLIPTFQKDEAVSNWKKTLGTRVESLYDAASVTGAGTITQLTGVGAIGRYPKYAGVINDFNKSLDNSINSMFSNPYNISSVLTENTGKYNDKSYIFDREEAKADPSKILLKIDPTTHLRTLDDTAPHYEAQKKEAMDYMRADMLAAIDSEVKITTTAQTGELSTEGTKYRADKASKEKEAENFGMQLANLVSGDKEKSDAAVKYFAGYKVPLNREQGKIKITGENNTFVDYAYGKKTPDELARAMVSALNVGGLPEDLILKAAAKYNKGRKTNITDLSEGISTTQAPFTADIPATIFKDKIEESISSLKDELKDIAQGFIVSDVSGWNDNNIKVQGPSGAIFEFESKADDVAAANIKKRIDKFVKKEVEILKEKEAAANKTQGTTTTSGGKVR
tara:strand:+ start:363 stop:2132 length:1770 start_codon:yes stop_codon:yes gene_type:complete